jgi:hypothetical protein
MKNPTSNGNDLYQVGNDYPQVADKYFELSSYKDGIYTELKSDYNPVTNELSADPFFDLKDMKGLNKRILNVLPQSGWKDPDATPASAFSGAKYLSDEYATAVASADLGEEVKA